MRNENNKNAKIALPNELVLQGALEEDYAAHFDFSKVTALTLQRSEIAKNLKMILQQTAALRELKLFPLSKDLSQIVQNVCS